MLAKLLLRGNHIVKMHSVEMYSHVLYLLCEIFQTFVKELKQNYL